MEEKKGADPKKIVAVQMLSIGAVLFLFGLIVFVLSPLGRMTPVIRTWSLASNISIIAVGLFFAIGGFIRFKRAKRA
jgi:low affinity Fe/Cu permease